MKDIEPDYLHTLFAAPPGASDEVEVAFPLVEVPQHLSAKLKAIAASVPADEAEEVTQKLSKSEARRGVVVSWPAVTSIAATFLVAIMGFQFYQQQQTLNQLEQAQADLATALHYLGEANRITQAQVMESLNDTITKDGTNTKTIPRIEPAINNERNRLGLEVKTPNRSL